MAKTNKYVEPKKLEMVPGAAAPTVNALVIADGHSVALPKGIKKLTLPPMVKPEQVPVGGLLSGVVVALAASLSSRADMRESKLIHLRHESGQEFLFPLTGVVKKALGGNEGVEKIVGKTLFLQRTADGETKKYGAPNDPPKKVFMFDVYVAD